MYHWKAMAELNISTGNVLEKRRIKVEINEKENFKLFTRKSYRLQILIRNTSKLSDHEDIIFILIYKIFSNIESLKVCKIFLLF